MPKPPVPPSVDELLQRPNPAVLASLQPDGAPHSVATWYIWETGRVLVNMAESRRRLEYLRADPRVALTILDEQSWYRHVSLTGVVASLHHDADLSDIDRISTHYSGRAFRTRDVPRWSAWIDLTSWHGWADAGPWPSR